MTGFSEKNGVLHVEGISLSDLAKNVGTPAYIYSSAHIEHQFNALKQAMVQALPKDRQPLFCYACKANSNIGILALLKSLGSCLEVVSEGELRRGLAAGFSPDQIVMTGVGKTDEEIAFALNAGIHQLNVESLPELEAIQRVAARMNKQAAVVFRLNPNIAGAAVHAKTSTGGKRDKFGIGKDQITEGFAMAESMSHIKALGISVHIGSQIADVKKFEQAFSSLPALVNELRSKGYTVSRLDIGGGFPIQYNQENLLDLDYYAQWVKDIILPLDTEIIMEPGRYYVGNSGVLLTKAIFIKQTQDHDFLILDAGMSDLIRPTLYDAYHGIEPVENRKRPIKTYDVVGPICESGDTFSKGREIPEMKAGELAVILSAGAYGSCMASNYNTRRMPPEILVRGDSYTIIRPRQTYEDIIGQEIIPDWLG